VSEKTKQLTPEMTVLLERLHGIADTGVWTERMLTTLVTGIKGGRWHSLSDKVCREDLLQRSFARVKRNDGASGVDQVTINRFEKNLGHHLATLQKELSKGSYRPLAARRIQIPKGKGKTRSLGIPTVRDRVAQNALKAVVEPIFERDFSENSHGFRPKRKCSDALSAVDEHLAKGFCCVVDADVEGFFDNVCHDRLMDLVREKIADGKVLGMIERSLKQKVMEGMKEWRPDKGTPQGAVLSPLLANIYMHGLDVKMEANGFRMVRYADDFIVCCKEPEEAERALVIIREWMEEAKLSLHPEKTRIVDLRKKERFTFLGYEYGLSQRSRLARRWPSKKSEKNIREKVRSLTKRCNGHSMSVIIQRITPITRGWYNYFSDSAGGSFSGLDGWMRMRLRSILRKRSGRRGRGRGVDHQDWPNPYFERLGFFSLDAAHARKLSTPSG
jgi:RNA-directed DNA polymerase